MCVPTVIVCTHTHMNMNRLSDDDLCIVFDATGTSPLVLKMVQRRWATLLPAVTETPVSAVMSTVAMLRWARDNGCPWSKRTCTTVAAGGNLDVLRWAHANGCPWGEKTCHAAAHRGHVEVVEWAVTRGCPWDRTQCLFALRYNRHRHIHKHDFNDFVARCTT